MINMHRSRQKLIHLSPLSVYLVVLMIIFCALSGCDSQSAQVAEKPTSSPWVAVLKGEVSVEGGLVSIDAPRGGIIREVLVEEGDTVQQNDLLARIDDRDAVKNLAVITEQYKQAEKDIVWVKEKLRIARREHKRLEDLGNMLISQQEIDKTGDEVRLLNRELSVKQASLSVLTAQVEAAKLEVDQHLVRAPMNGKIVKRDARVGEGVSMYNITRLFLLAPDTPRIIRAELEDIYANDVQLGQYAEVLLENSTAKTFPAQVIRLSEVIGYRLPSDDPADKKDVRILECVLSFNSDQLRIGQRILVRILPTNSPIQ